MTRFAFIILLSAIAVPALAQVAPPPPPPPPPPPLAPQTRDFRVDVTGTSALAGVVMADDGTGRPVRRATVTVRGSGVPSGRVLMTDADGRFAFVDLPAGTYSIQAAKPGWVTGYYGARESWRSPGTPVVIGDGERRSDLELRMAPGGVITGRIYNQLGQPQEGARVMALERRRTGGRDVYGRARTSGTSSFVTDDRGEYRIFGLPPGEFVIGANITTSPRATTTLTTPEEVRWAEQVNRGGMGTPGPLPPPGPAVAYSPVFYPGVVEPNLATPVSLGLGEERAAVDFQLQFAPTASISGTLTMPDGRPAQNVALLMTSMARLELTTSILAGSPLNRSSAGRDGSFRFESITPGDYSISARASSEPPAARGRGAGPGAQATNDLWVHYDVSVTGSDVTGLELRLQPGLTLSGRVVFDGVVLPPPENLARVSLRVAPASDDQVSIGVEPAQVEADGSFSVTGLAPGSYRLMAAVPQTGAREGPIWFADTADVGGRNAFVEPFEVMAGRDIADVVVTFSDQAAELTGQVTDGEGRPVQGLTMVIFSADPTTWDSPTTLGTARRSIPLDTEGRYRLPTMRPGDYFLAALADPADADLSDPAYLEQLAANAITISLARGETKVQDIRIGSSGGA